MFKVIETVLAASENKIPLVPNMPNNWKRQGAGPNLAQEGMKHDDDNISIVNSSECPVSTPKSTGSETQLTKWQFKYYKTLKTTISALQAKFSLI